MSTEDLSMDDFRQEIEDSFKTVEEGDVLTGTVIAVDENDVTLDLKYYTEGIIHNADYSREPGFLAKNEVNVGDEVTATVIKKDDGHGHILLSRVLANDVMAWDKLEQLKEDKTVLDVVVKGVVKAGVIAYVEGVRGFIPASKLSLNYVENLEDYLNKTIQVQVHDIERDKKRLILSAREVLRAARDEERKRKISNVQVGFVTEGTVETIKPYGAFVNMGDGLSGMVHVSQISQKRVKAPKDVLKEGEEVKVKIIGIKDGKISLSMKALAETPAQAVEEESYELPKSEALTTSLGSLFKNIKL